MRRKYTVRIGTKEKEILKLVGKGILLSVGLAATVALPGLPAALAPFIKNASQKNSFKRSIKSLEEKTLIYLSGDKITISKKGMESLELLNAGDITIKKVKWDGKWRVIAYDIPNKYKTKRDYLRKKLIDLGFKNIQESIWIIPYECKEEIAIFAQSLGLSPFVIFMETGHLPKQEELQKHFNL